MKKLIVNIISVMAIVFTLTFCLPYDYRDGKIVETTSAKEKELCEGPRFFKFVIWPTISYNEGNFPLEMLTLSLWTYDTICYGMPVPLK